MNRLIPATVAYAVSLIDVPSSPSITTQFLAFLRQRVVGEAEAPPEGVNLLLCNSVTFFAITFDYHFQRSANECLRIFAEAMRSFLGKTKPLV